MSDEAYEDEPTPLSYFEHVKRVQDDGIGFSVDVYRNTETGEIIIAVRGTDDLVDMNNGWGVISSPQHVAVRELYAEVSASNLGAKLSGTGHSMGGGLPLVGRASIDSTNGGDVIVFNSMGYAGRKPENLVNIGSAAPHVIKAGSFAGYPAVDTKVLSVIDPLTKITGGLQAGIKLLDVSGKKIPAR